MPQNSITSFFKRYLKYWVFFCVALGLSLMSLSALQSKAIAYIPSFSFTLYSVYGLIVVQQIGIKVSGGYFNMHYMLGKSVYQIHFEFLRLILQHILTMSIFTTLVLLLTILVIESDLKQINLQWLHSYLNILIYFFLFLYTITPVFLFIGNKNAIYFYLTLLILIVATEYFSNMGGNKMATLFFKNYGLNQLLMSILNWNFTLKQLLSFVVMFGGLFFLNVRYAKRICHIREQY